MHNLGPIYGALIGDIAGSTLEQKPPAKLDRKEIPSLLRAGRITDDTVLTIATMEVLYKTKSTPGDFRKAYFEYGNEYLDVGYGKNFKKFLETGEVVNSYGNGCLMRLSPIALIEEPFRKELALNSIQFTHNTLDAEYAVTTYLNILNRINEFTNQTNPESLDPYFRFNLDYDHLFETHTFNSQALPTLRDAFICLHKSSSFEEVLWKALQLGGDTDTIAAIACGLAGNIFPIQTEWKKLAESKLPLKLLQVFKECQ